MSPGRCLVCLLDLRDSAGDYHAACARDLFGTKTVPRIDVDLARLHTLGLAMVGRSSLAGVQRKISLRAMGERETLRFEIGAGQFILKPQAAIYPKIPENEHVTMRIADAFGIDVAPCGLVRLTDGSLAFITRRFDRVAAGDRIAKLRQEDFCQLAEKAPKEKYDGSAELMFRLVKRYATEPLIEAQKLFRSLLFCWWTGNGDAHLKNFALLEAEPALHRLSPAYDLLNTRLAIADDVLALPIGGKKDGLTRRVWLELCEYAGLPKKIGDRELSRLAAAKEKSLDLVARSFLDDAMKKTYAALLEERAELINR